MDAKPAPPDIDAYIAEFPEPVGAILEQVRQTIRAAAPQAEEAIRYRMPTFRLRGNLVHFAAFKHHIGLYPAPSGILAFAEELAPYRHAKGSVRFPLDQPIPYALLGKIVAYPVTESLGEADAAAGDSRPG